MVNCVNLYCDDKSRQATGMLPLQCLQRVQWFVESSTDMRLCCLSVGFLLVFF